MHSLTVLLIHINQRFFFVGAILIKSLAIIPMLFTSNVPNWNACIICMYYLKIFLAPSSASNALRCCRNMLIAIFSILVTLHAFSVRITVPSTTQALPFFWIPFPDTEVWTTPPPPRSMDVIYRDFWNENDPSQLNRFYNIKYSGKLERVSRNYIDIGGKVYSPCNNFFEDFGHLKWEY